MSIRTTLNSNMEDRMTKSIEQEAYFFQEVEPYVEEGVNVPYISLEEIPCEK